MISYNIKNDREKSLLNKAYKRLNLNAELYITDNCILDYYIKRGGAEACSSVYQYIYLLGKHFENTMTPYLYCKNATELCTKIFDLKILDKGDYIVFDDGKNPRSFCSYSDIGSFNNLQNYNDKTARVECTDINEFVNFYNWLYEEDIKIEDMNNNKMPELKSGYCVEIDHDYNTSYLIFKNSIGKLCFINTNTQSWNVISGNFIDKITTIYESGNCTLKHTCIWRRPKETVLTMQDIADKFGVDVNTLKIKK